MAQTHCDYFIKAIRSQGSHSSFSCDSLCFGAAVGALYPITLTWSPVQWAPYKMKQRIIFPEKHLTIQRLVSSQGMLSPLLSTDDSSTQKRCPSLLHGSFPMLQQQDPEKRRCATPGAWQALPPACCCPMPPEGLQPSYVGRGGMG